MEDDKKNNALTKEEERVIINKGTERPFSGKYHDLFANGLYVCRRCGEPLYRSADKFDSRCGWPSFDDEVSGAVRREIDADGRRTEILCNKCDGHLGHVFEGEHLTDKNTRHCVNSVSLKFIPASHLKKAYFAGGCFWGVEYYLELLPGVIDVASGYMGGKTENPTYKEISTGTTGHYEAVEVIYDDREATYEKIAREFFEIHDPTQKNGQGPDIGEQYKSAVFYNDDSERETTLKLIKILREKGFDVATELLEVSPFYPAEGYHQNYYERKGSLPYCHGKTERF